MDGEEVVFELLIDWLILGDVCVVDLFVNELCDMLFVFCVCVG